MNSLIRNKVFGGGFACLTLFVINVSAHSYMSCVNYDESSNTCKGFPDYADALLHKGASNPDGIIKHGKPDKLCLRPQTGNDDKFTTAYPQAVVAAGSTLQIRWPDNNHATLFSKDNGGEKKVYIFDAGTNGDSVDDSLFSTKPIGELDYYKCKPSVDAKDASGDRLGSDDGRTANCGDSLKLPDSFASGERTIVWAWNLGGTQGVKYEYVNCATIKVTGGNGNTTATLAESKSASAATSSTTSVEGVDSSADSAKSSNTDAATLAGSSDDVEEDESEKTDSNTPIAAMGNGAGSNDEKRQYYGSGRNNRGGRFNKDCDKKRRRYRRHY